MTRATGDTTLELLDRFRGHRILVVGDVMLDRFVWGEVDRISPEAPVPVVRVLRETSTLGGAANVAVNLSALEVAPVLVGIVGADEAGDAIRCSAREAGIESFLLTDPARPTTVKSRVIARAQQVVRVDRENGRRLDPLVRSELADRAREALTRVDAVVISDYNKGVLDPDLLRPLLGDARAHRLPVVVDPKLANFPHYQPVTLMTPNEAEAASATARQIGSDEECLGAAKEILSRLDTEAVLLTRGERGMLLVRRVGEPRFIPAAAREVYDVTGAGDTVAAVAGAVLAAGGDVETAAVIANRAAALVVGKVGTASVSAAGLREAMERSLP